MKPLLILFSTTTLVLWILSQYTHLVTPQIWTTQGFFFCTFFIGYRLYLISKSRPANQFHIFHFTSMTLRFLGSIIFLFFMVTRLDSQKVTFIVDFLFLYLFYSGFEIYLLLNNLRTDFKKGDESK